MTPMMLELVVQSPTVLFVQWEFPFLGEGACTMRLYRLPGVDALPQYGTICLELPLQQPAGSLYFDQLAPGAHYVVEIGIREEGIFYPLRRSNVASTPRGHTVAEEGARIATVAAARTPWDWLAEGFGVASYYPGE